MDGEFIETQCQAFEVVPPMIATAKISSDVSKAVKVVPKMVEFRDARAAVKKGNCELGDSSPRSHSKQTNVVWVSLSRLERK